MSKDYYEYLDLLLSLFIDYSTDMNQNYPTTVEEAIEYFTTVQAFIDWIVNIPIPGIHKKYHLIHFCEVKNLEYTRDDVETVYPREMG